MIKGEEIKKILDFYVKVDSLKDILIDSKYSIADHLFGSMIIATAMDSEFKEAEDLNKLYRMMLLEEIDSVYQTDIFKFDFSISDNYLYNFNSGIEFLEEVKEARSRNSKNAELIRKYKTIDSMLTKLIDRKENKVSMERLVKEGSLIISLATDKKEYECRKVFLFYYLNHRLKNKVRSGWDSKHWNVKTNRKETVSEHIIGTIGLAIIINSELDYDLDFSKVLKTLVIHETGETVINDITPFDGITLEEKAKIEHEAMDFVLGFLKEKDSLLSLLLEFDKHENKEANLAYLIDKIEADLKAKIYQDKGLQHSLDDQASNVVFNSSKVQDMVKNGAKDVFDIWYEWDKSKYENDINFKKILKIARDNNLLTLDNNVLKERIDLTDNENESIINLLSEPIRKIYENENVDCVYITNYQTPDDRKGIIKVYSLLNDRIHDYEYGCLINQMKEEVNSKNKTEADILFLYDFIDKYSKTPFDGNETYRLEELSEASIIFDKTGNITKLKNYIESMKHLYKFYLVDYVPSFTEELKEEYKAIQLKRKKD